jgi:hypothetical protein
MKNSWIILSAATLLFASCKKTQDTITDGSSVNPVLANVSVITGQQMAKAQSDVNATNSSKIKMLGYSKVGVINSDNEKTALLSSIFSTNAKTIVGSLNNPEQIKVVADKDVVRNDEQQQTRQNIISTVTAKTTIGTDVLQVKWLVNGTTVETTTALANANGIIWDNFIYNLPTFTVVEGQSNSTYDAAARTQVFTAAPVSVIASFLGLQVAKVTYNLQAVWDYTPKQYTSKIYSVVKDIGFGGSGDGRGNAFWPYTTTKKTVQGYYAIAASTANVSFSFSGGGGGNTAWSVSFVGGSGSSSTGFKLINTPVNP